MRGNLADLAATGLASEPTLRKWIAGQPDQPWIIKRGSNGDAYEIDIPGAVEAFRGEEMAKLEAARARANDLKQFGLSLGLGGAHDDASAQISIAERKQLLEEELVAIKVARERRELINREEVQAALGNVLMKHRQRGETFASRISKKIDLTREQIIAIEKMIRDDQNAFADEMEGLTGDVGSDAAPAALDHPAVHDRRGTGPESGAQLSPAREADGQRLGDQAQGL